MSGVCVAHAAVIQQAFVKSNIANVSLPLKIIQAADDRIAKVAATRDLATIAGDKLTYVELPNFYHEVVPPPSLRSFFIVLDVCQ